MGITNDCARWDGRYSSEDTCRDRDNDEQKVDLVLGTWLHLRHAWRNVG